MGRRHQLALTTNAEDADTNAELNKSPLKAMILSTVLIITDAFVIDNNDNLFFLHFYCIFCIGLIAFCFLNEMFWSKLYFIVLILEDGVQFFFPVLVNLF